MRPILIPSGKIYFTIALLALLCFTIFAEGGDKKPFIVNKNAGEPVFKKFNVNRISTWFKNNGAADISLDGHSGFIYPRGFNRTSIFESGFLWGGKIDSEIHIGGSTYWQGTTPGKILNSGLPWNQLIAEDPSAGNVRCYRVRPDYLTGSMHAEIEDGEGTETEIRAAYEKDWNEWPASDGAPFEDINHDGIYNPYADIPGVPGASQTIWFVCNDIDPVQSRLMYNSAPMGIEEQVTIWGYNSESPLGNTIFRKYKIINKSSTTFSDMYFSMWYDPDIGNAVNDFVGCDSALNITYAYNAPGEDPEYDFTPPSVSFALLQGPVIPGQPEDTALYNGRYILGMKNMPMTAHYFNVSYDSMYSDPILTEYNSALKMYNMLQGLRPRTGDLYPDPVTGYRTRFPLNGDPIQQTGWVDGITYPEGDRRAGLSSGPFNLVPGDTQEVIFGEIAATGSNNLGSVSVLKSYVRSVREFFKGKKEIPPALPEPTAAFIDTGGVIQLNWGIDSVFNNLIENFNKNGYIFQGYNVYQIPDGLPFKTNAKKIAVFDIADGITSIADTSFDYETGVYSYGIQQLGSDSGIKRSLSTNMDNILNSPLSLGTTYYYAVTAYAYNPGISAGPNNIESLIDVYKVFFNDRDDSRIKDALNADQTSGNGKGAVSISVYNPDEIKDHDYKVFFSSDDSHTYWNLKDLTTGQNLLENQVVVNNYNYYNSSEYIGDPLVDGFIITVDALLGPPQEISSFSLNEGSSSLISVGNIPSLTETVINEFIYGFRPSWASNTFGFGTQEKEKLEQDYELRYTGILDTSVTGTDTLIFVSGGGQMATIFSTVNNEAGLADHPMNPLPGVAEPFLIRIPFEVWNKDEQRQVNIMFRDRFQVPDANPFRAWNSENRNYMIIVNNGYNPDIPITPESYAAEDATWIITIYSTRLQIGDVITLTYPNPVAAGEDEFTFSTSTLVGTEELTRPFFYSLYQNYPNPFNPTTRIKFDLEKKGMVKLDVYNILGEKVIGLINEELSAGSHEIVFNAAGFASGIYFYVINAGDKFYSAKKMILVK